jgi:coproporphyrinogen III oxidase-like Fe-S oxidoreductase
MSKGIDWSALRSKAIPKGLLPLVETWERELEPLHHHGLLHREGSRLALTRKGILLSNRVLEVFI